MKPAEISTTEQQVRDVLEQDIGVDPEQIMSSSHFVDDLDLDSLDHTEFIMGLEEKFKLEIPDDDAEKLETVQQVVAYLEKRKAV